MKPCKHHRLFTIQSLLVFFIASLFIVPEALAVDNKKGKTNKDIIVHACTQSLGYGKFKVHFSYENPNDYDIRVSKSKSWIYFSPGNKRKRGPWTFKKGIHEDFLTYTIRGHEKVKWVFTNLSGKKVTIVAKPYSGQCDHNNIPEDFNNILLDGKWQVASFKSRYDQTSAFDNVELEFDENGKVFGESDRKNVVGKWSGKSYSDDIKLKIKFPWSYPFRKINEKWIVRNYNSQRIELTTKHYYDEDEDEDEDDDDDDDDDDDKRWGHYYYGKKLILEKVNDQLIVPVFAQEDGKTGQVLDLPLEALGAGSDEDPSDLVYQIDGDEVQIEVVAFPQTVNEVLNLLTNTYDRNFSEDPSQSDFVVDPQYVLESEALVFDLFFPINLLTELNERDDIINFVRTAYSPFLNSGIVTSQGDGAQRSDEARSSFQFEYNGAQRNLDGSGVKIGVISNSYGTEPFTTVPKPQTDVNNGDLPGSGNPAGYDQPVSVLKEYAYGVDSDEGRAMMQIIHDVAPGAELAFHTGSTSLREFEIAIQSLADDGCDIIVDDVTFVTEPFFSDGNASGLINSYVSGNDKMYFTSAGNFGDKGYQGIFNATTQPLNSSLFGTDATAHVFGTNADGSEDYTQLISVTAGTYMIVLQWDEQYASQGDSQGALTDLDLYLLTDNGSLIVGNNRINVDGDPTEILVFEAIGEAVANLVIVNESGTTPPGLAFRYIAFRSAGLTFLEYGQNAPTVSGHAMASGAVTTGAVFHGNAASPVPESFTSRGGLLANGRDLEIDIAAPDGGNINVVNFSDDTDGDGFPNFFGTSASAPHAAGAMALLMSASKSWYPAGIPDEVAPGATSGEKILTLFQNSALNAGDEDLVGAGLLQADFALDQVASRKPELLSLNVGEGQIPSGDTIEVTLAGNHFNEDSFVLFDGKSIPGRLLSNGDLSAEIPPFNGNPGLSVVNPSITPGLTDGGASEPLFFFEGDKIAFQVKSDTVEIKFGQDIVFTYQLMGLPEGTDLESLGLPEVIFTTTAVLPYPDVNNYLITPSFAEELSDEQNNKFQVNFIQSILSVSRNDLTIMAMDQSITYGDAVTVQLDYQIQDESITDLEGLISIIQNSHQSTYFPENRLAVMNKFKALVNEGKVSLLEGSSWMITEAAVNKFKALVNDFNVVELEAELLNDYENDPNNGIPNKFKALVNGQSLIDGNAQIFDAFENKFKALVNDTGLGGESDQNDYSTGIAIVDEEDGSIPQIYSIDLLSGLDVTTIDNDPHYIVPGSFNDALASNFNVVYVPGRLSVSPGELVALVDPNTTEIAYGDSIPDFTSSVSGLAYDDIASIEYTLAPGFESEVPPVGSYEVLQSVSVTNPELEDKTSNYIITTDTGILNVSKSPNLTSALMPWGVERAFLLFNTEHQSDPDAKAVTYEMEEAGCFSEFPDGTVQMTGKIVAKNNPEDRFAFEIWMTDRKNWEEWSESGRSYVSQGSGIDIGDLYLEWDFFIIDP